MAQMQQLQSDFSCFADPSLKPGDGTITIGSLCTLVRAMGKNPTQEELQKIIATIDPQGEGCVNFDQFMRVMQMPMNAAETEADLVSAFRAFDKDANGTVTDVELSTVMRTFGEPLNDEEIDQLMTAAAPFKDGTGRIQDNVSLCQGRNNLNSGGQKAGVGVALVRP